MKTTDIGFERFEQNFYADPNTAFIKPKPDTRVHAVPINEGMKIFMTDEKSFLEVDRQLNEYGFITRCDPEQWSIYIVSAPYERDDGSVVRIL